MVELPAGTVTFLFTDLEGSARLWDEYPDAMRIALARHDAILREVIASHDGLVVKTTGDGVHAVFATAHEAVAAAVAAQCAVAEEDFGEPGELRIRVGIHTGPAELRDGDYYGSSVNRAARLMSAAHGGQIVVSLATEELVRDVLRHDVVLVDLGEHRLRGLARSERVFGVTAPGLRGSFPPLDSVDALRTNLPVPVSSFVGRADVVDKVQAAVRSSSIVTLTGVGGVGKTRLALEAAARMVGEFADGVWLCELASVSTPEAVNETLASALSVQPALGRDLRETILEHLAARRLLLVLDNCEHLLEAAARLVDALQRRCAGVVVLATSREGLGAAGEQIMAVTSLDVPAESANAAEIAESEAALLFCDRARSAKSDFELADHNVAAVGVICRRLDGIPLAIELAAARVRALPPDDIVDRLDQRFRLLTRGSRASLERHQTLRATIDWSYGLLDEHERDGLNALSVFAGGCDLQAAEAVLSSDDFDALDVVDVLTRLVDKSLVLADDDENRVRYRLLETIRQYAQEQLEATGDTPAARRRHADYYVSVAEAVGARLRSDQELHTAQEAARDTDNFRTALQWALEEPSLDHAMRLLAPLAVQGVQIGDSAMDWADTACDMQHADRHRLFPVVASGAASAAANGGAFDRAQALVDRIEAAEVALGERTADACSGPANLAFFAGDFALARARSEDWITLARAGADRYQLARALLSLGAALSIGGDIEAGLAALAEAVDVARDAGILTVLATALTAMAIFMSPEDSRALAALDEAVEVGTRIGDRQAVSTATGNKGWFAARHQDWHGALQASRDFDEMRLEFRLSVASSPGAFALAPVALVELGRLEPAGVVLGHYETFARGIPGPPWSLAMVESARETLTEAMSPDEFAALFARGAALLPEEAAAYLQMAITQALEASPYPSDIAGRSATAE